MKFHDSWFFIGVLAFIFLVWIATGGPTHPLAFSGPRLAAPQELGGGTYLSFPRASFGFGKGQNVVLPGSSDGGAVPGSSASGQGSLIGGTTFGSASPYRGIVSMDHYVSGAGAAEPKNEYIRVHVSQNASVAVDLTGWKVKSEATGNVGVIPKGTEIPTSGIVNPAQDIVLTAGDDALIISSQSPIGASFRENKCIGYFSSFQTFSPPLPQNCPAPADELTTFYGGEYIRDSGCISYVNNLARCQVALTPPVTASGACQTFVVKYFNYNGCMTAHQNDANFKGDAWRIYLGRSSSMWRTNHEVIKLLDKEDKTVDVFSY